MRQLCPTCTMLSSFVPSPIDVTPSAARSTHELAPISTKSPISTRPTCGNLCHRSCSITYPKPSAPITHPECRIDPRPISTLSYTVTFGCSTHPSPSATRLPTTHPAPIDVATPILVPSPTTACGPTYTIAPISTSLPTTAVEC